MNDLFKINVQFDEKGDELEKYSTIKKNKI